MALVVTGPEKEIRSDELDLHVEHDSLSFEPALASWIKGNEARACISGATDRSWAIFYCQKLYCVQQMFHLEFVCNNLSVGNVNGNIFSRRFCSPVTVIGPGTSNVVAQRYGMYLYSQGLKWFEDSMQEKLVTTLCIYNTDLYVAPAILLVVKA